jgi:hypothetical protein
MKFVAGLLIAWAILFAIDTVLIMKKFAHSGCWISSVTPAGVTVKCPHTLF